MSIGVVKPKNQIKQKRFITDDLLERTYNELPRPSIYTLLADHGEELFPSDFFCDLYPSKRGRPTTPARTIATVMVLGAFEGLADEKATAKLKYDLRWKVAAGIAIDAPVFNYSVICLLRSRLLNSSSPERIFDRVLSFAKDNKIVISKIRSIDSTALYDSVETKSTIRMIEAALSDIESEIRYEIPSLSRPSFDDSKDVSNYIEALCARSLSHIEKYSQCESETLGENLAFLSSILDQDTESDENGKRSIKDGVSKDRIISKVDPEARHGRKSASRHFDGYKSHVASDPTTGLITAIKVTPGNVSDKEATLDLVRDLGSVPEETEVALAQPEEVLPSSATECDLSSKQQSAKDFNQAVITDEDGQLRLNPEVSFVIGDSAYGGFDTRDDLAHRGIGILSRVPTPHNRDGKFAKDAFQIDTANSCVTCPAGNVVAYKVSHLGQGAVSFGTSCATCPLKERCTTSKSGRTIRIHRYQAELERLRAQQRDPVFIALYNHYRSFAERINAQLVKVLHGGRKSRYIGLEKSQFCISQRAASVNLSRISKLLVT